MDKKTQSFQLKMASDMGYDVTDPHAVESLIACIRYCDLSFSDRKLRDTDIAEQLGISLPILHTLKRSDAIGVATQIVLAEFLESTSRADIRGTLFQIYHDGLPDVLRNVVRIARGEVMGEDEDGKKFHAPFRDQVQAATLLLNNPLGNAFLTNTFMGETQSLDESAHLEMRQRLLNGRVLDLDDVIDGSVINAIVP